MTEDKARKALKKLEKAGIEASIREGYSGRGMYGRTTWGIDLHAAYMLDEAQNAAPMLKKCSVDGMGKGLIIY